MQKGPHLHFSCLNCEQEVPLSLVDLQEHLPCPSCKRRYALADESLKRQLQKFEALCLQIRESEEILGETSVGVDVAGTQVKIPYRILLARLNGCLELNIGDESITINFRMETA